jgi:hypothetical protein
MQAGRKSILLQFAILSEEEVNFVQRLCIVLSRLAFYIGKEVNLQLFCLQLALFK